MSCPLCEEVSEYAELQIGSRRGARCGMCGLVFILRGDHLSLEAEKSRYLLHQNARTDQKYVEFLKTLAQPFQKFIPASANVLDYGSGPEPVMAEMLRESGHYVSLYDPFFAAHDLAFYADYDGIVCCETVEHFRDPRAEWQKLSDLLRPGGVLGVMTLMPKSETDFATWWYAKDPTHVAFYGEQTIRWIAATFKFEILELSDRVVIFRKSKRDSI
jgi:SAM-dependent methyltransferase